MAVDRKCGSPPPSSCRSHGVALPRHLGLAKCHPPTPVIPPPPSRHFRDHHLRSSLAFSQEGGPRPSRRIPPDDRSGRTPSRSLGCGGRRSTGLRRPAGNRLHEDGSPARLSPSLAKEKPGEPPRHKTIESEGGQGLVCLELPEIMHEKIGGEPGGGEGHRPARKGQPDRLGGAEA